MRYLSVGFFIIIFGCLSPVVAQAQGEQSKQSIEVSGVTREYIQYLPDGFLPQRSYPVFFIFHGHNGTAEGAMNNYQLKALADEEQFILVAPESLTPPSHDFVVDIPFVGKKTVFENYDLTGKRWEIAPMQQPLAKRCTSMDIDFVRAMIGSLQSNYNVADSHIFAAGHSQGAVFAYYTAMCVEEVDGFWSQSGGLVDILKDTQLRQSVSQELKDLMDLVQTFPDFLFESIMGVPRNELVFPIPVLKDRTPPAAILHAESDTVVFYERSLKLQDALESVGGNVQFTTTPNSLGHGWDPNNNNDQWKFLIDETGPVVVPDPVWAPVHFSVLGAFNSVLWRNSSDGLWKMQFDYDDPTNPQEIIQPYGPFVDFDLRDVEVSWLAPHYFWWSLAVQPDGQLALWRQKADGSRQTLAWHGPYEDRMFQDLALNSKGLPVLLYQQNNGEARIEYLRGNGQQIIKAGVLKQSYLFGAPTADRVWSPRFMVFDDKNKVRLLWEDENGDIELWRIRNAKVENKHKLSAPFGYRVADLELAWESGQVLNRVLWVDANGGALVWLIDNDTDKLIREFSIPSDRWWKTREMETDMYGSVRVWQVHKYGDVSRVLLLDSISGEIIGSEFYNLP